MAYTFSVNNTPSTGYVAVYTLVTTLVSAGWSIKGSSNATSFNNTDGTYCASAADLSHASAWVRVQAPSTTGGLAAQTREFLFMAAASGRSWRIKYSASAGFTGAPIGGGSIDAIHSPSAADEVVMAGVANDVVGSVLTNWLPVDGTYRWHICCGGAAEFYSFYCFSVTTSTNTIGGGMFLDVMAPGSFSALDVDPAVVHVAHATVSAWGNAVMGGGTSNGGAAITNVTNPALARAWLGSTSAAGVLTSGCNSVNVNLIPYGGGSSGGTYAAFGGNSTIGTNSWSGKDDMLPAWWMRTGISTAPTGLKGCSTLIQYGGVIRSTLDTADVSGTRDKIQMASVNGNSTTIIWVPWSGALVTI
jgi:hypothetical protein